MEGRGEFADLVGWLVRQTPAGTVKQLARLSGVPERTLQKWLAGEHPRQRLTRNVEQLDDWAARTAPDYPPHGRRLTTIVTAGEAMVAPVTPRRRWAVPAALAAVIVVVLALAISLLTVRVVHAHGSAGEVVEYGDNHRGSPVFATTYGAAVPADVPPRIPYGTRVEVRCAAPNRSGIASVSAFYLVDGGPWHDLWVVADTMTNGGPVGNTDTPDVDPRVPACATGEH